MTSADHSGLLAAVEASMRGIGEEAARLDAAAAFPHAAFATLSEIGLLTATLPRDLGGKDFGYNEDGAQALLKLFVLLGEASLPVARLYEAHVNALQLICRYGSAQLAQRAAHDAQQGHLFALWVTDPPQGGATMKPTPGGFLLHGTKAFCSGAGTATRALITVATNTGTQMLVIGLPPETRVRPSVIKLAGMRAAVTGSIDVTGMVSALEDMLGAEGDYLREPLFSAGAWRGSAAALGGLTALVKLHRDELRRRGRDADPYQRQRFGQLMIAYETAHLWMERAALRGCLEDGEADGVVAYINLARLAVEAACLDAMRLTQRSLGLGAFMKGSRAELLCRDLATYLRQPAPDETLDKAANFYFRGTLPGET